MKTKTILRKGTWRSMCAALMVTCSVFSQQAAAQAIVAPTNADNGLGPGGYPEAASIDYTPNCAAGNPCAALANPPQLTAIVADNGGGAPTLYINDQVTTASLAVPLPPASFPDVTIGNDPTTPTQYIVAVVAVGPTNDVNLVTYTVNGAGSGILTIVNTGFYNITTTGTATGKVHIDNEAQYSNLTVAGLGGLPVTNNFALTWQDNFSGIKGYFASLNTPAAGVTVTINPSLNYTNPDVALVERFNPGTGAMEDWALFTFVDLTPVFPANQIMYYQEWNTAAAGPTGALVYDNLHRYVSYGPGVGAGTVRIDAIDDFNFNAPGPMVYPGTPPAISAFFDIVATVPNSPGPGARLLEYNNLTWAAMGTDITTPVAGLAVNKNIFAVVACGGGPFYTVGYWSIGAGPVAYYATAVDWGTGVPTTDPNAYRINFNPTPVGLPAAGLALCGTSNVDAAASQQVFAAWENGALFDKYTITTAPYSFRHTPSPTPTIVNNAEWQLFPNPAADEVTLTAPTGFSTKDGDNYHITDLTGKELMHGSISNATQISVNNLPAGMYLLQVNTQSATTHTMKFVKE